MQINFAHLCDYAIVSQDGKLSLIGMFSRITVPDLPAVHGQMCIAFEIEVNYAELNREFEVRLEVVDADGATLHKTDAKIQLSGKAKPGNNPKIAQIIQLNGIRFNRVGGHNVNIFLGRELKAQIAFEVAKRPNKPGQGRAGLPAR